MNHNHKPSPHIAVLKDEVAKLFSDLNQNGTVIDCTFGAGGHSNAILSDRPDIRLLCFDRDASVEQYAHTLQSKYHNITGSISFHHQSFSKVTHYLHSHNIHSIDGALFDLGLSTMQLDSSRGFSFLRNDPLDMKMDNSSSSIDASYIVNKYSEEDLYKIISEYGGEKYAKPIAEFIHQARKVQPITTTRELSDIIISAVSKYGYSSKIHPATRTFQAIRIEVNKELDEIALALPPVLEMLNVNGIVSVITFHSLEDIIVKNIFREYSKKIKVNKYKQDTASHSMQTPCSKQFKVICNTTPLPEEIKNNPRARSARLRSICRTK